MKQMKRALMGLVMLFTLLVGCSTVVEELVITYGDRAELKIGETLQLKCNKTNGILNDIIWSIGEDKSGQESCITLSDTGNVLANFVGSAVVVARAGNYSDSIIIKVVDIEKSLSISTNQPAINVGDSLEIDITARPIELLDQVSFEITTGETFATISNNILTAVKPGTVKLRAKVEDIYSNELTIEIVSNNELSQIVLSVSTDSLAVGSSIDLITTTYPMGVEANISFQVKKNSNAVSIVGNKLQALLPDKEVVIVAIANGIISNEISVTTKSSIIIPESINLSINKSVLGINEIATLSVETIPSNATEEISFAIKSGNSVCSINSNILTGLKKGTCVVVAYYKDIFSNEITISVEDKILDPYEGMSSTTFYRNYSVAQSKIDSYYRSLHYFMSGDIVVPDQAPNLSDYRPKYNDMYIRNSDANLSVDKSTYTVVDSVNSEVLKVYEGGAYISLNEVAAYLFAFGDVPANYITKNSANPARNSWGAYLRLNHRYYSSDTSSYQYEPMMPNCKYDNGTLQYYEVDLGTTGTDCDPSFPNRIYNDGDTITRGAARLVYSRYTTSGDEVPFDEKYVFYTYNHYNDFREYLNYYEGWGEMFGNITGGGKISSHTDYNPTQYIKSYHKKLI